MFHPGKTSFNQPLEIELKYPQVLQNSSANSILTKKSAKELSLETFNQKITKAAAPEFICTHQRTIGAGRSNYTWFNASIITGGRTGSEEAINWHQLHVQSTCDIQPEEEDQQLRIDWTGWLFDHFNCFWNSREGRCKNYCEDSCLGGRDRSNWTPTISNCRNSNAIDPTHTQLTKIIPSALLSS